MSNYRLEGQNHHVIGLQNGELNFFANDEIYSQAEYGIFESANNNLAIPRNQFFSYTPDAHIGVGTAIGTTAVWNMSDGFVSPSIVGVDIGCGISVHLTNLHKDDLKDKQLLRRIMDATEKYLPTNERTNSNYTDINIEEVIKHGLHGLPEKYRYAFGESSLTHVENSKFDFDFKYLKGLPQKIWGASHGQLGSLGGGNHFWNILNISVDENQKELAKEWGLFDGQVVLMIHSGSRAWGNILGREYTKLVQGEMEKWGIRNPDPKLIYCPIQSEAGQTYINLMYSALNFAVANRHMIAHASLRGFREVLGEDFQLPRLYDLMHNYALKEYHQPATRLVHRKGATRALPAGHFLNVPAFKKTGHPALIPGSMATSSYIMVGEAAGEKNFYSICHGAGRARSRRATKELVTVDEFASAMKVGTEDEILVNHHTLQNIIDESPQAYKDVDQIVDSVVGAGLASVVAKCEPLAVIKGL